MATKLDPRVQMAPAYAAQKRTVRRPQHRFQLRTLPYQLQPFMIAPVLPGETLQNLLLQSRVVTDPLKPDMRLVGWWCEYYFFYVRVRDLDAKESFERMFIDPTADMSSLVSAGDPATYHFNGGINFTEMCLKRVVEDYFRDEGEEFDDNEIGGMPAAKIYGRGQEDWTESLTLASDYADRRVDLDSDGDGTITVDDVSRAYAEWNAMHDAGLMDMDFEDYARTFGVKVREAEDSPNLRKPELIRYLREWTYPTNIVEPTTGIPSTAATWSVADRSDKRILCDEPGFLFGITVQRPKVYLRGLLGSLAHGMTDARAWLPAVLHGEWTASHKQFADDAGPLAGQFTEDYWVDLRDLLTNGDQYVNFDPSTTPGHLNLPEPDAQRRYAAESDVMDMFMTGDDLDRVIRTDGVVSLGILGRQTDRTKSLQMARA